MKQVLVTGGAGFIGHQLLKRLSQLDYKIILIDDLSNANKYFQNDSISFHREDIRNKNSISNIFKYEKINSCIHLAAKISVSDSVKNPFETLDLNINGTLTILEA